MNKCLKETILVLVEEKITSQCNVQDTSDTSRTPFYVDTWMFSRYLQNTCTIIASFYKISQIQENILDKNTKSLIFYQPWPVWKLFTKLNFNLTVQEKVQIFTEQIIRFKIMINTFIKYGS